MISVQTANIQLTVGLSSHAPNVNVSGTNVNCAFVTNWAAVADPPPGHTWDSVQILSLKVKCVDSPDLDRTYYPGGGPQPPSLAKTIRIASTKFSDATAIDFEVTGTFRLTDFSPGGLGTMDYPFTHTPVINAYNRALCFRTTDAPTIPSWIIANRWKLTPGHTLTPGEFADPLASKTFLESNLRYQTFFFASTHGSSETYVDSNWVSSNMNDPNTNITRSENSSYLFSNRPSTVPPMNFAILYGCSTLEGTGNPGWPNSFGVNGSTNRAYLGFAGMLPDTWVDGNGKERNASEHANKLFDLLKAGKRCFEAVFDANAAFQPLYPMLLVGDSDARVYLVYLTQSERQTLTQGEIDNWYYVLP